MNGVAQPRPYKSDHARSPPIGHVAARLLHQFLRAFWTREAGKSRRPDIYSPEADQYRSMTGCEGLPRRWHQVPSAASAAT